MYGQPHCCDTLIPNPGTSGTFLYAGDPDYTYTFRVTATDHVDNATAKESGASTAAVTKYYLFGGQRVAMRQGSAVYYLHGDHLGSTSLTTDASGGLVSQARYTPFGELNWEGGVSASPTDFGFTGQRADSYIKLLDYGARWYDARLGRFISADSIVPGAGNPMAYDRYSYGLNNPSRYVDPTGHIACEDLGTEDCGENGEFTNKDILPARDNSSFVYSVAEYYVKRIDDVKLAFTSLDAMVAIIDVAAGVYGDDWGGMLDSLSNAFLGVATHGALTLELAVAATMINGCAGVGRNAKDCPDGKYRFTDSGFHKDYHDEDNQVYHVWGFIANTANPNYLFGGVVSTAEAWIGNWVHDPLQSVLNVDGGWGTSWYDFTLSEQGMYIGNLITVGTSLGILKTSDLGNIVRCLLGPDCGGSQGRLAELEARWGPLKGQK